MKLRELLQQMQEVQKKIESSELWIVGGTPRDRFLHHLENIADLDLTTGDKTVAYFSTEFANFLQKKYHISRQEMDDGHSSIQIGSFKIDFSSNFNTPNIDSILSKMGIQSPTEMQKEMFSRDFTCNALLLSLDLKKLVDPTHHGFQDLKDKTIRTCLSPDITLTSNRNRVVRSIYLAAKLDFEVDPKIIQFVQAHPESAKISTQKVMNEKINEAFTRNPERAFHIVNQMNLWDYIPITKTVYPYFEKRNIKKAYFQGGGGVNEPIPKKTKYKKDKAPPAQPRFKEPFYKNYDLYDTGPEGPGAGWHDMHKYKSIQEFLKEKRKRMKNKYKASELVQVADQLYKLAIDFPADEYIDAPFSSPDMAGANLIGGLADAVTPPEDFEGKEPSELNYGRDYVQEEQPSSTIDEEALESLMNKYLSPAPNHGLYGLPDGVDLPQEEEPVSSNINPEYGTQENGTTIYEDIW